MKTKKKKTKSTKSELMRQLRANAFKLAQPGKYTAAGVKQLFPELSERATWEIGCELAQISYVMDYEVDHLEIKHELYNKINLYNQDCLDFYKEYLKHNKKLDDYLLLTSGAEEGDTHEL